MAQEDRLERLVELIGFLLDRNQAVTRNELVADFPFYDGDSGRRRFEDDKATLAQIGVTLHTEVRPNGATEYRIRREDYELPDLDLTEDEAVALSLAMATVDLDGVLWGRLAGIRLGLAPSPVPTEAVLPGLDLLPVLEEAARTRTPVHLRYNRTDRSVEPYAVVAKNGHWYVPGHDSRRDKPLAFRIDRIDASSVALGEPGSFEVPADVVPADLVPGEAHVMGDGPEITAVLRVDRRLLGVVAQVWTNAHSPTPCGGGELRVHVPLRHVDGFCTQVLSFGDRIVVEEPPDLRDEIVTRLRHIARGTD